MKLEDIYTEWEKDSKIDNSDLGNESLKIPQLHYKYYKLLSMERLRKVQYENELKDLKKDLQEYYTVGLSEEDLKARGWTPYPKLLPKVNEVVRQHIEGNKLVTALYLKVAAQDEKVDLIIDILKNISQRNFIIKNAIDWAKFTNGMM